MNRNHPQDRVPPRVPGEERSGLRALRGTLGMISFLSWRNLWRNRLRSALTVGAMVVGMTLMIAYLALMEGFFRQMTGFATQISIGHLQIHREEYIQNQDLYSLVPWKLLDHLRETTTYRYTPRIYAAGLASAGDASSGVLLKGIDPASEPGVTQLHLRLRKGQFALHDTHQAFPHGVDGEPVPVYPVIIGPQLARNLQVDLGAELVLITQAADGSIGNGLFQVRGILAPIDPAFDRMGVLMSLEAINALMFLAGGVHELAVSTGDGLALEEAREFVARSISAWETAQPRGDPPAPQSQDDPLRVRTWMEINPTLHNTISSSEAVIYIVAVIVFLIAAMGILNTMLMATYERRHELGLLRALGMRRGAMMAMVLLEAFFLAVLAALAGAGTGSALAWYLEVQGWDYSRWLPEGMDLLGVVIDPVFRGYLLPEHVWISVAMMTVTSLLAALLPSWRTARIEPARVLHV